MDNRQLLQYIQLQQQQQQLLQRQQQPGAQQQQVAAQQQQQQQPGSQMAMLQQLRQQQAVTAAWQQQAQQQQQQQLQLQLQHELQKRQQQQQPPQNVPASLSAWQKHCKEEAQEKLSDAKKRLHELMQNVRHEETVKGQLGEQQVRCQAEEEKLRKAFGVVDSKMSFVVSEEAVHRSKAATVTALAERVKGHQSSIAAQGQLLSKLRGAVAQRERDVKQMRSDAMHKIVSATPHHNGRIGVRELQFRFPGLPLPDTLRWVRAYVHDEGTVVPCPEPTFAAPPDVCLLTDQTARSATVLDGVRYTVKLFFLSAAARENAPQSTHPHDLLRMVGARVLDSGEFTCYGGSWCFEKDGGDPTAIATLVSVLKRHVKMQCGVDISTIPCTRFCTFHYEDEVVEYLMPDPTQVKRLHLHPMACVESRKLAHAADAVAAPPVVANGGKKGKPAAVVPQGGAVAQGARSAPTDTCAGHEKNIARVVSEPHALPLRNSIDGPVAAAPPPSAVEIALLGQFVDHRLRRSAAQGVLVHASKRQKRSRSAAFLPLRYDDGAALKKARPGHHPALVQRSKVCTATTDPHSVRAYAFFDRAATPSAHPSYQCNRSELLDGIVTDGRHLTLREAEALLAGIGFTADAPVRPYSDLCSELKHEETYEVAPHHIRHDVTL